MNCKRCGKWFDPSYIDEFGVQVRSYTRKNCNECADEIAKHRLGIYKDNKKKCSSCGKLLDISFFYKERTEKAKPSGHCRECVRIVTKTRQRRIKQQMIDYKGGKCEICGYCKSTAAMDFHHKDPSKKDFTIAAAKNVSMSAKIKEELDKCMLLCANCHREIHSNIEFIEKEADVTLVMLEASPVVPGVSSMYRTLPEAKKHVHLCDYKPARKFEVSKEELEKLVWEMPTTHVCKLFNVSDKAISKRCKLLGIEKPPRGYWTKVKANK